MGWLQTIGFLTVGLLVEIFAAGLFLNIRRRRGFGISIGLLTCFGFGLLLIGAFRTNPVGGTRTVEGIIHGGAAIAVFWLFPIAISFLLPSIRKDRNWQGMSLYTVITIVLGAIFVIVRLFLPIKLSWFGLYERILVANAIIWIEVLAIRLLIFPLDNSVEPSKPTIPLTKLFERAGASVIKSSFLSIREYSERLLPNDL